jgi:hypothetical protein
MPQSSQPQGALATYIGSRRGVCVSPRPDFLTQRRTNPPLAKTKTDSQQSCELAGPVRLLTVVGAVRFVTVDCVVSEVRQRNTSAKTAISVTYIARPPGLAAETRFSMMSMSGKDRATIPFRARIVSDIRAIGKTHC